MTLSKAALPIVATEAALKYLCIAVVYDIIYL